MKIVFVGPTYPQAASIAGDIQIRPPAVQGDIFRAVGEGASAIGIIDGNFEYVAPVWHKEILHALSFGVSMLGAASMGALRAAECAAYGMTGVGVIYDMYASGELVDDADVCQVHAPRELGYRALSEPLVNVIASLRQMVAGKLIAPDEQERLQETAQKIFFKDRTWKAIAARSGIAQERQRELLALFASHAVDLKRQDASALIDAVAALPPERSAPPSDWTFRSTSQWRALENGDPGRQ